MPEVWSTERGGAPRSVSSISFRNRLRSRGDGSTQARRRHTPERSSSSSPVPSRGHWRYGLDAPPALVLIKPVRPAEKRGGLARKHAQRRGRGPQPFLRLSAALDLGNRSP